MKPVSSLRAVGLTLVLSLSLGICATASAGAGPKAVDNSYINWTWPSVVTSMETDIQFEVAPPVGTTTFYSNQFALADANNQYVDGGYIGFQTNFNGEGLRRSVLFSIWNSTGATASGPGAFCQTFGHEGSGWQCFMPYDWVAGKNYRARVVKQGALGFSGYIVDLSTNPPTETLIGTIQARADNPDEPSATVAGIGASMSQWVEWYGPRMGGCDNITYSKALRGMPLGNAGSVQAVAGTPKFTHFDDPARCHNVASWAASGTSSYMEQGNPGTSSAVQLISASGKFVYAAPTSYPVAGGSVAICGGGGIKADATGARDCSQITRVALPNGKIALQTDSGYYLSCASGGGSTVSATSDRAGVNESFTETSVSGKLYFQSANGKYLTAGGSDLRCDAASAGANEGFTTLVNIAKDAAVTVSSESTATQQLGVKAVDNVVSGFPHAELQVHEWATNGENAGAWIHLNWAEPMSVSAVTLYDRPNDFDRILTGTLMFSDGTTVPVGALPNDAVQGLTVNFAPRSTSSLKFTVNSTAGQGSTGLAEIQVWQGAAAPAFSCSAVTATNSAHVTAGRAYTVVTGTWYKTTTWYANGSNQSLGTSGSTSNQLAQTSPGYWVKGTCPVAPTIGTPSAAVSGTSVTVSGSATGASKVEVEFDGNGSWLLATGTSSWSLTKTGLSVGTHSVRARATNTANQVSAPSAAVSFTTTEAPVEACFTATNPAHASAGRATLMYGSLYYANGSNTYLGTSTATTSLKQQGANYWVKVTSCP